MVNLATIISSTFLANWRNSKSLKKPHCPLSGKSGGEVFKLLLVNLFCISFVVGSFVSSFPLTSTHRRWARNRCAIVRNKDTTANGASFGRVVYFNPFTFTENCQHT